MEKKLYIKEPGSAITHFIGMIMAIIAAIPLLYRAAREPSKLYIVSLTIYAASLILLYAASTTYHTFDISEKVNTVLKKIDHMMISVLFAGSYTPVCLLVIGGRKGITLLCIGMGIRDCSASLSKPSGYSVRNGYLPFYTLAWDGLACLHFLQSLIICQLLLSDGF